MFEFLFIKNSRPENCEALKLKNNIYRSKELSPRRKASIKVRRWICSFPDIIGIAFGNEVSLTPKQIFLLERSTFLLFFEKNYSRLAYLLFIWASKRLYKSGWNSKTMTKGLKTERELAAEWNCTAHVMLWMYVFT